MRFPVFPVFSVAEILVFIICVDGLVFEWEFPVCDGKNEFPVSVYPAGLRACGYGTCANILLWRSGLQIKMSTFFKLKIQK